MRENCNFFEKLCCENGYGSKVNHGVAKLKSFSDEIRDFLGRDHEERLKLASSVKNGKDNSFVGKLKKCVKILCNANHRDPSLPTLLASEVVLMKSFFKNRMRNCDG